MGEVNLGAQPLPLQLRYAVGSLEPVEMGVSMAESSPAADLSVPLATLAGLSDSEMKLLVAALQETGKVNSRSDLVSLGVKAVASGEKDISDLLAFAVSYAEVGIGRGGADDPRFLQLLFRAASGADIDKDVLTERLKQLFEAPAVRLVAIAAIAQRSDAAIAMNFSISTDARPIIVDDEVRRLHLLHTLRINVTDDLYSGTESTLTAVLDDEDLSRLSTLIDETVRNRQVIASGFKQPVWGEKLDE